MDASGSQFKAVIYAHFGLFSPSIFDLHFGHWTKRAKSKSLPWWLMHNINNLLSRSQMSMCVREGNWPPFYIQKHTLN